MKHSYFYDSRDDFLVGTFVECGFLDGRRLEYVKLGSCLSGIVVLL